MILFSLHVIHGPTPNTYFPPYLQAVTFLQKDSLSCPKLNHDFANDVQLFFSFIFVTSIKGGPHHHTYGAIFHPNTFHNLTSFYFMKWQIFLSSSIAMLKEIPSGVFFFQVFFLSNRKWSIGRLGKVNLIRLRIPPKEVEFFPMRIFLNYQQA